MDLAQLIDRHRDGLIAQFGHRLLPSQLRALDAIQNCRRNTSDQTVVAACSDCGFGVQGESEMLILTRRYGEEIKIGDHVDVVVLGVTGNQVRLGIKAPSDQMILRKGSSTENRWPRQAKPARKQGWHTHLPAALLPSQQSTRLER